MKGSGVLFEALAAVIGRRSRCDLYHSALEVTVPEGRFAIEMAPVPDHFSNRRGAMAGGAVGSRRLPRLRVFRYEIRCWRNGEIPDLDAAVGGPVVVSDDAYLAQRILDVVREVPTPVWGRDELGAEEMWNSNSVTSWLLASSGVATAGYGLPAGGRAPGWDAGIVIATRASSAREGAFAEQRDHAA